MANPHRGEVDVGGHVLRFTVNSICEIEEKTGVNMSDFLGKMDGSPSFSTIRLLFWGGLLHRVPDATLQSAGDAIDEVGLTAASNAVSEALEHWAEKPEAQPAENR